jgi:hypothetical protein
LNNNIELKIPEAVLNIVKSQEFIDNKAELPNEEDFIFYFIKSNMVKNLSNGPEMCSDIWIHYFEGGLEPKIDYSQPSSYFIDNIIRDKKRDIYSLTLVRDSINEIENASDDIIYLHIVRAIDALINDYWTSKIHTRYIEDTLASWGASVIEYLLKKHSFEKDDKERLMRKLSEAILSIDRKEHPIPGFDLSDWIINKPSELSIKYFKNTGKGEPKFEFCHPNYKKIIKPEKFFVKRLRILIEGIDKQNKGEGILPYYYGSRSLTAKDIIKVAQVGSVDTTIIDKSRKGPMKIQYLVSDFNSHIKKTIPEFKGDPLEWVSYKNVDPQLKINIKIEVVY